MTDRNHVHGDTDTWWTISNTELTRALQEAHNGTPPQIVMLELFANSDTDPVDDDAGRFCHVCEEYTHVDEVGDVWTCEVCGIEWDNLT